jgi:hypothetical protein
MAIPFIKLVGFVTSVVSEADSVLSFYFPCKHLLNKFNKKSCVHEARGLTSISEKKNN